MLYVTIFSTVLTSSSDLPFLFFRTSLMPFCLTFRMFCLDCSHAAFAIFVKFSRYSCVTLTIQVSKTMFHVKKKNQNSVYVTVALAVLSIFCLAKKTAAFKRSDILSISDLGVMIQSYKQQRKTFKKPLR